MQQQSATKKQIVKFFLDNGVLLSQEFLDGLDKEERLDEVKAKLERISSEQLLLLNEDTTRLLEKNIDGINWLELEKGKALSEKGKPDMHKRAMEHFENEPAVLPKQPASPQGATVASQQEDASTPKPSVFSRVKVVSSYNEPTKKLDTQDFVAYFNVRFKEIEKLLRNRNELQNVSSISRLLSKTERENVSLIGIMKEKTITHSGKMILVVEDLTGEIKIMVDNSKEELFSSAKNLVLDEVIGITGSIGSKIVFCTGIIWPDVPLVKEAKKAPDESYALFLSDLHVGSKKFLKDEFEKFIRWINKEHGHDKHTHIIDNIGYIFIIGDLVDGIGIYPGQEHELEITDIYEQYKECARLLAQLPKHIPIIICPGNHDAVRMSEPQPPFYRDFAKPLFELPNVLVVSNPSFVNIHASERFSGFDVLLYHGYCFDYYIQNVDNIRNSGGYDRADLVMKFLLQRRHISPTHTATLYIPDGKRDPLVIDRVPDFFATGHIHKTAVASYRNVSLICGSCWQAKTAFQERVGHHPEPARVPVVNLQTRETKVLRF
jgi:DNA polymerase II small subunit